MIETAEQLYEFVNRVSRSSSGYGYDDIATQFDNAMRLRSSGLEIFGAIRNVLKEQRPRLKEVIPDEELEEAIRFVDGAFGSR